MKKIFLLCFFLTMGYTNTFAQVEGEPTSTELSSTPPITYSSLISRMAVNLSKDAYTDKLIPVFSKWNPGTSTKAQALDILKSLEFHMKTLHFKPEWKKDQLIWSEKLAKTTEKTDIVLLLREFEAGLQLTAFEKTWTTDRGAWLTDVDTYLKK